MNKFKPTPEGFQQARHYAMLTDRLTRFESVKDSYLQLHLANTWYENEHNGESFYEN